jgi:hypothetical protein
MNLRDVGSETSVNDSVKTNKNYKLLHDIFHIGPGIIPKLPYQARQQTLIKLVGQGKYPSI